MTDTGFPAATAARERAATLFPRDGADWRAYWLPTAIVLFASSQGAAQPAPNAAEEAGAASLVNAAEYRRLRCLLSEEATGRQRELQAHPQSLLRWSNPEVGRVYGDVFVWTDDGRPAAVACIYRFYTPWQSLTAEFRALAPSTPPVVERDGERIWTPQSSDIEWKPVPDAPTPAPSAAARQRQMRSVAGRFSAALTDRRSDTAGDLKQLRLLTQPVFGYSAADAGEKTGGALFAFVIGTDPEVFVLLESRGAPQPRWYYAVVRMNRDPIEVRLDGKAVWTAPYLDAEEVKNPDCAYCSVELPLSADQR